jgi:hypothetical protein
MSAREQLIEAIARVLAERCGDSWAAGDAARNYWRRRTESVLLTLSDLGAVVLMPVKPAQSVANVIVLDEKHVLRTTQEERDAGVYVNALEVQPT